MSALAVLAILFLSLMRPCLIWQISALSKSIYRMFVLRLYRSCS